MNIWKEDLALEKRVYQYLSVKRAPEINFTPHLQSPQSWTLNHVHFSSGQLTMSQFHCVSEMFNPLL